MDFAVNLAPHHKSELYLHNPVMTAAGTFGTGIELASQYDLEGLGGIVTRTFSLRPQRGHASHRIVQSPAGIIHSTGLPNAGIGSAIRQHAPIWARWSMPVIISITADTPQQYGQLANRVEGVAGISGIEVSLPHLSDQTETATLSGMTAAIREIAMTSSVPILAKIEPGTTDVRRLAESSVRAGAQAVTISGSLPAMAIDTGFSNGISSAFFGQLSGPATRPVTMRNVALAAAAIDVPIIASGGIMSGNDVAAFIMAGASAAQIGLATFRDPGAPWRILDEFKNWCMAEGIGSLDQIRGTARFRG